MSIFVILFMASKNAGTRRRIAVSQSLHQRDGRDLPEDATAHIELPSRRCSRGRAVTVGFGLIRRRDLE